MSNNYNIVVPEGDAYPKQEFVDSYLNSIDDIPTCADIEKLKDMGITAAHEYIREKLGKKKKVRLPQSLRAAAEPAASRRRSRTAPAYTEPETWQIRSCLKKS